MLPESHAPALLDRYRGDYRISGRASPGVDRKAAGRRGRMASEGEILVFQIEDSVVGGDGEPSPWARSGQWNDWWISSK